MGFSLIMKRRVFSIIQSLAVEYEEKFGKRKGLTPLITNQLLAEALIARKLLPDNFLQTEYGSADPLKEGYAYRGYRNKEAREKRSKKLDEQKQSKEWSTRFNNAVKQWDEMSEKSKQYYVTKARELIEQVPEAKLILELHDKDIKKKRR